MLLLLTHRRAAISHQIIKRPLRLLRLGNIFGFKHLASVPYHLIDIDRVVPAFVGSVVIDTTDILVLLGQFSKPGASQHLLSGDGAYPDFPLADMAENFRTVIFPPVNLAD